MGCGCGKSREERNAALQERAARIQAARVEAAQRREQRLAARQTAKQKAA